MSSNNNGNNNTPPSPPPPAPAPYDAKNDHLYKLSEEDKKAGLDAIEPLPGTINLYIVRYRKQPIKVDLSLKDWAAKLKTESNDCGVPESALTVTLKRLHLIETEKLLEVARHNEIQRNKDIADKSSSSATTKAVANAMV